MSTAPADDAVGQRAGEPHHGRQGAAPRRARRAGAGRGRGPLGTEAAQEPRAVEPIRAAITTSGRASTSAAIAAVSGSAPAASTRSWRRPRGRPPRPGRRPRPRRRRRAVRWRRRPRRPAGRHRRGDLGRGHPSSAVTGRRKPVVHGYSVASASCGAALKASSCGMHCSLRVKRAARFVSVPIEPATTWAPASIAVCSASSVRSGSRRSSTTRRSRRRSPSAPVKFGVVDRRAHPGDDRRPLRGGHAAAQRGGHQTGSVSVIGAVTASGSGQIVVSTRHAPVGTVVAGEASRRKAVTGPARAGTVIVVRGALPPTTGRRSCPSWSATSCTHRRRRRARRRAGFGSSPARPLRHVPPGRTLPTRSRVRPGAPPRTFGG